MSARQTFCAAGLHLIGTTEKLETTKEDFRVIGVHWWAKELTLALLKRTWTLHDPSLSSKFALQASDYSCPSCHSRDKHIDIEVFMEMGDIIVIFQHVGLLAFELPFHHA